MNLITSFHNNFLFDNQYRLRDTVQPQDSVEAIWTSHTYEGQTISNKESSEHRIDDSVRITTVTDSIRNKQLFIWNRRQSFFFGAGTVSLIAGVAIGKTALVATGAATVIPLLAVALVCGEIAFVTFKLGFEAWEQKKAWTNPLAQVQKERAACHTIRQAIHGFQPLQVGRIVTREEAQQLFFERMKTFKNYTVQTNLDQENKETVIRSFFEINHFASSQLEGIFDANVDLRSPKDQTVIYRTKLEAFSKQFAVLQAEYQFMKSSKRILNAKIGGMMLSHQISKNVTHQLVNQAILQAIGALSNTTNLSQLNKASNFVIKLCQESNERKNKEIEENVAEYKRAVRQGTNPLLEQEWKAMKICLDRLEDCRHPEPNAALLLARFTPSYELTTEGLIHELSITAESQWGQFDSQTQTDIRHILNKASEILREKEQKTS